MPQYISAMSSHRDLAAAFLSSLDPPIVAPEIDVTAFLASAAADGLLGLLHATVCASGATPHLPPALVDGLRAGAHRQAALERVQRAELQRVLAAARSRGLDVL